MAKEFGSHTLAEAQESLEEQKIGIEFVHGSGLRKSEAQKQWERLAELCGRWEKYEEQLEIMGTERNSYSRTD